MGLEPGHGTTSGSTVGFIDSGPVTRGVNGNGSWWVPGHAELLLGPQKVRLELGHGTASGFTVGSQVTGSKVSRPVILGATGHGSS